jgi:hypothetical protein
MSDDIPVPLTFLIDVQNFLESPAPSFVGTDGDTELFYGRLSAWLGSVQAWVYTAEDKERH